MKNNKTIIRKTAPKRTNMITDKKDPNLPEDSYHYYHKMSSVRTKVLKMKDILIDRTAKFQTIKNSAEKYIEPRPVTTWYPVTHWCYLSRDGAKAKYLITMIQ